MRTPSTSTLLFSLIFVSSGTATAAVTMKPGLWEITSNNQMAGLQMPAIPPEQMAKMKAMGIQLSFMSLMLINGVVNLVLLIPAAPGGLGTFDAAGKAMLQVFGVGSELALGYTLLLRVALWVPITVLGAILFVREGFSLTTDVSKLQTEYADASHEPQV